MALPLTRSRQRQDGHDSSEGPYGGGDSEAPPHRSGRSNRTWIMLVLVLLIAAVALLVMERSAGPPVSVLPTPELEGEPDIYMESPVVSQFREDGTLEYRLIAQHASHYQRDSLTLLTEPHLTLLPRQGPQWTVSARQGILHRPPPGGADVPEETVVLEEDVLLERSAPDGEPLRLATPSLRLFPRRQYAETDRDVMIASSFGRTTATGLEGDLQSGVIRLYSMDDSPVRTVLRPDQFK